LWESGDTSHIFYFFFGLPAFPGKISRSSFFINPSIPRGLPADAALLIDYSTSLSKGKIIEEAKMKVEDMILR